MTNIVAKEKADFEGNKFMIQVIARGSYLDAGCGNGKIYKVEAITIRLNHIAFNAWILSGMRDTRECYDTNEEWEQHKLEYKGKREAARAEILKALGIEIDPEKQSVCITQSLSEVFTVVNITEGII